MITHGEERKREERKRLNLIEKGKEEYVKNRRPLRSNEICSLDLVKHRGVSRWLNVVKTTSERKAEGCGGIAVDMAGISL